MNPNLHPNRWEISDTPEEDIVDVDWLDAPDAKAMAKRYGLDETMPAQAADLHGTVRALVFDPAHEDGPELALLFFHPRDGWWGETVIPPTRDRAGILAACRWILAEHPF